MSRHQDHPLRIHLVAPTGTRNWLGAAYCAIMLVVGCAKLERRDAVVALIAHAAALLAAAFDLTPGLTWKGVGPAQRANMSPWLRGWMVTVALFGLGLPLVCASWSLPARGHAGLLVVQIFGERVSAALEWNAVAAYVAPVALTAYRVHASALWFAAARGPERCPRDDQRIPVGRQSFLHAPVRQRAAARRESFFAPVRAAPDPLEPQPRQLLRRAAPATPAPPLRATHAHPVGRTPPAEQLATYNDTRQIFAD